MEGDDTEEKKMPDVVDAVDRKKLDEDGHMKETVTRLLQQRHPDNIKTRKRHRKKMAMSFR